jgi:NitT/TauT family transport system permease protein
MRAPTRPRLIPRWAGDIAQPVASLVILVALWEMSCRVFHVRAFLLPAPSAMFTDTAQLSGPVLMHTHATGETVLLGFAA